MSTPRRPPREMESPMTDTKKKDGFRHGEGEHYRGLPDPNSPAGGEGDLGTTLPTEEEVAEVEKKAGKR